MHFIIVGGCGFIGSKISERLSADGHTMVCVNRGAYSHRALTGRTCVCADYRDVAAMSALLIAGSTLIHLGTQSVPRTSAQLGVQGILEEVQANSLLFECAARRGVRRILFASSGGSVYGECSKGKPIDERHSTEPISPHGLVKLMTELALRHVAARSDMSATALRMGNVYGPSQPKRPSFGVVPTFLSNIRSDNISELWGSYVVRDYIFVDDVAEAVVRAATAVAALPPVLNIGSGVGHSVAEIYTILQEILGRTVDVRMLPKPAVDPSWIVLDTALSIRHLGEYSVTTLLDGLTRVASHSESGEPQVPPSGCGPQT